MWEINFCAKICVMCRVNAGECNIKVHTTTSPPTQFEARHFSPRHGSKPQKPLWKFIYSTLFLHLVCSNNRAAEHSRLSDEPFVSAADDNFSTNTSTPTSLKKQESIESPLKDVGYRKRNSKSLPLRNDGSLDYDGEQFVILNLLSYDDGGRWLILNC